MKVNDGEHFDMTVTFVHVDMMPRYSKDLRPVLLKILTRYNKGEIGLDQLLTEVHKKTGFLAHSVTETSMQATKGLDFGVGNVAMTVEVKL